MNGYTIKKRKDPWGTIVYIVFDKNGFQLFDSFDTRAEAREELMHYLFG